MKNKIKFNLDKKTRKHDVYIRLAKCLFRYIRLKEIDGFVGKDNTITHEELRIEVSNEISRNNWVKETDKENLDLYMYFIEYVTQRVLHGYILNTKKNNEYFIPGLLNNPHRGYFIALTNEEVDNYLTNRSELLKSYSYSLDIRVRQADQHIKLLNSGENMDKLNPSIEYI